MERNLVTVNGSVSRPRRTWWKNTGPGELSFTPMATMRSRGDVSRSTAVLMQRSKARFMHWSQGLRWGWAISRKGSPARSVRLERQLMSS